MNYRKQSDGRSWLVYAKEESGERKLAVVRIDPDATPYKAEVERLDAQDSELEDLEHLAGKILKRFSEAALKVCIACANPLIEGYVTALAEACGARDKVLFRRYENCSSEEMFELMAKEMYWEEITEERTFSEVWLVADRESWPLSVFDKTLRSKFPSIHFAFTHPSFEYWLLLHDPEFDGRLPFDKEEIVSAGQSEERLGRGRFRKTIVCEIVRGTSATACRKVFEERLPRYARKPSSPPVHFMSGLREALRRTKEADPENADWLSQMPQLFEKLCKLGKRNPEDVLAELEAKAAEAPQIAPDAPIPVIEVLPQESLEEAKDGQDDAPEDDSAPEESEEVRGPGRMAEVFAELFDLIGKWLKNSAALSDEDCPRARILLERLMEWGELEYREFKRGQPMFSGTMLADTALLMNGDEAPARSCAVRHITKMRSLLGSLTKNKFQRTQKSVLLLLAEVRLCLTWLDRLTVADAKGEGQTDAGEATAPVEPETPGAEVTAEAGDDEPASEPENGTPADSQKSQQDAQENEPEKTAPESPLEFCEVSDKKAAEAVRSLEESLRPFTAKKNWRLDRNRTDEASEDIDTVFMWAYGLLLKTTGRSYVRTAACQAEIDRIGRYETEMTRPAFVKACQSVIGALGNVGSLGRDAAEGTLLTLLDRLEVVNEWLTLDCAEPF